MSEVTTTTFNDLVAAFGDKILDPVSDVHIWEMKPYEPVGPLDPDEAFAKKIQQGFAPAERRSRLRRRWFRCLKNNGAL